MITNPNTGGKNYPLGVPKVYAGQYITPSKFNNLSTAIQRNSVVSVKGAEVSRTSSGISIVNPNEVYGILPFEVMVLGNSVVVFNGNIWTNKNYEADAKQNIPAYTGTMKIPKGDYTCSVTGHGEVQYPFGIKFPHGGGDKIVWFDTSPAKPDLKYTDKAAFEAAQNPVAIAFISSNFIVYQITTGDIWLRDAAFDYDIHPFKIIANYEEGTGGNAGSYKFRVQYGTVNNIEPKYENGKPLSDLTVKLPLTWATTYVYLRIEGGAYPLPFPTKVDVISSDAGLLPDTIGEEGGYAYITIGYMTTDPQLTNGQPYVIGQAVTHSLRAECHRFQTNSVYDTFFYAI